MVDLPHDARIRWLLVRLARLHEGGAEPVAGLVQPDQRFFPDHVAGDPKGLQRLVRRVMKHAGLTDVPLQVQVTMGEEEAGGGSCSSGACAAPIPKSAPSRRIVEHGDGYVLTLQQGELRHPVVLTTVLARAAADVFLREAELYDQFEPAERTLAIELGAIMLGFGVLIANGSYLYSKSCGGVNVTSVTTLPVDEVTFALAVFGALHGVSKTEARRHLETTPRAHFDLAATWAESNKKVVALVGSDRAAIEAGSYSLNEARGLLSRLFGIGKAKSATAPADAELEAVAADLQRAKKRSPGDAKRAARMASLREMVDESLDSA